jgi:hypothetical protein
MTQTRPAAGAEMLTAGLLALWAALGLCPSALGQSVDAELQGRVRDESGAAVPRATVHVASQATGLLRETSADPEGRYLIFDLPSGEYEVRADFAGFSPDIRPAVRLHVGTTVTLDLMVRVQTLSESVSVRAAEALPETSTHTLARTIRTEELDTLPVIDRNFNHLATLVPGVTNTGVYGGVDIDGSRDFQNAYLVDGLSAERQNIGNQRVPYAQDWIDEFQVLTSGANAEFGGAAGGVINAVTRSGSNRLSGRAYGFFRDDALDAMPPLVTRKPPLSEQRLGVMTGGPIVKDRAFYFGGLERLNSSSSSVVTSSFPAANGIVPSTSDQTLFLVKTDLGLTNVQRLRGRYISQRLRGTNQSVGGTSTEEHGQSLATDGNDVAAGWSWVSSHDSVTELRGGWSRSTPTSGCNYAATHPSGWFELSYPGAQFGCPVNFGRIGEDQAQIVGNFTWARGPHNVKIGGQWSGTTSSGDFRNVRDGRYSFATDVPFSLDNPASYPLAFVIIEGPTAWDVPSGAAGLFLQDAWRVADDVTVDLGIRYDVDGALTALNDTLRGTGRPPIDGDLNNVAPRAGVAWTPFEDRRTLVRGAAGLYYDQNHNNVASVLLLNNILVDRVVSINANSPLLNPLWPDIAGARQLLAGAVAQGQIPDLSGLGPLPVATNDIDRGLQVPATVQGSVGLVRQVAARVTASADVVFARGFDEYVIRNVNLDPNTLRPIDPAHSVISSFGNGGWSRYRALQLQLTADGASYHVRASETLASTRSNTNATLSSGVATNPFDYREDEGPADNDVRNAVSANGWVRLPWGLEASGIFSYRSALPFSATTTKRRPDGKPFGYRPEPRNSRRGDSDVSLDLRLVERIGLGGGRSASLVAEAFNVTNASNYTQYIGDIASTLFGHPTLAGPPRRVELGFRFDW